MKRIYKSKLSRFKSLELRNAAFEKLSDENKRKEIAWDGLKLVLAGQIGAAKGTYWNNKLSEYVWGKQDTSALGRLGRPEVQTAEELQQRLMEPPKCSVCARGLMMLSAIRVGNKIEPLTTFRSWYGPTTIANEVSICRGDDDTLEGKGFSLGDFMVMEKEYEQNYHGHPYRARTKKKLANICCNVIVNGNFHRADKTDYLEFFKITV